MLSESQVDQIAAPISDDRPAGIDTRIDRSFHRIKDARNEASRVEKRASEDLADSTKADKDAVTRSQSVTYWKTVVDLGQEALTKRTKDLDIASYMIEATVRTDGFAGLAAIFRATGLMVENCWDGMFPMPDDDDGVEITEEQILEDRILPLSRLSGGEGDGLLIEPLSWIEITGPNDPGPFCLWQYRQALEYEKCSDNEKEIRRGRGTVTMAQIESAVKQTSDSEFRELLDSILACRKEYESLIGKVTEKINGAGLARPPQVSSSRLLEEFDSCLMAVRHLTTGRIGDDEEEVSSTDPNINAPGTGSSNGSVDKTLRTREDAFRTLQRIAEFFEKTEPQSLIPAQLKKLVRLAKLSPAEYFSEILDNRDIRDQLFKNYGLELKKDDD